MAEKDYRIETFDFRENRRNFNTEIRTVASLPMPNRIIGRFAYCIHRLNRLASNYLTECRLNFEIGSLQTPFAIDNDVEIRNPSQLSVEKYCTIKTRSVLNARSDVRRFGITLGANTYLKEGCYFDAFGGYIDIAGFCAFGQNTWIHGGGGVRIGSHVIVGPNSLLVASNHNYQSFELPIMLQGDTGKGIVIGNNVWLGCSVVILDGVRIGNNCVIGAGTVVTKDVPENTLIYNKSNLIQKPIYK